MTRRETSVGIYPNSLMREAQRRTHVEVILNSPYVKGVPEKQHDTTFIDGTVTVSF